MQTLLHAYTARLLRLAQQHRAAHWMVAGPQFIGLHAHFEEAYHRLDEWADAAAERLCRLGGRPPLSLEEIAAAAPAAPLDAGQPVAGLLRQLAAVWEELGAAARGLADAADEAGDRVTTALADEQLAAIEKELWILGRLAA
jgi:starvation-inducible DNA-binding protein